MSESESLQIKIGIDGIVLQGRDAGSLRYFEQLLSGLAEEEPTNEYVIFANERVLSSPVIPRQKNFLLNKVNTHSLLPGAVQQQFHRTWHALGKLNLLHAATFITPLWFSGKTVMTVFDLTFLRHPKTQKWTGRFWWQLLGVAGIRKADHLIAISESTKRDLCSLMRIPAGRISVIYPYMQPQFKPVSDTEPIAAKYHLPDKYILNVGTLERRKNIVSLLHAFALAKRKAAIEHKLVLIGQRGWLYEDIFQTVEDLEIQQEVIFLGYVPDKDLPSLYSAADLFVYLSHYEGFGLPVLEAMACGVPVLTSSASSLPEVVGNAGILVPPTGIEQAAHEMIQILSDPDLREDMVRRGLVQAKSFSRERFVSETLSTYERVISAPQHLPTERSGVPTREAIEIQTRPRAPIPKIAYRIPDGVEPMIVQDHPILSTREGGRIAVDHTLLTIWKNAGKFELREIDKNFDTISSNPEYVRAALACLTEAGLLQREQDDHQNPPSLQMEDSLVSIIIVSFNSRDWLGKCLASIRAQYYSPIEIIIVDNASNDGSSDWIRENHPEVRLIQLESPLSLAHAINLGIKLARGEYFLLLNPDVEVHPTAIAHLVATAQTTANCAAVAAKLKFTWAPAFLNGLGNYVGAFYWGTDSALGHLDLGQFDSWDEVPSACFAATLITAKVWEEVGPIDEKYPLYYEDSDWCYRARLHGYIVRAAPQAVVYHAFSRRVPTGEESGLSPTKLRQVVFGRLRFVTKILGPTSMLQFAMNYFIEDLLKLILALILLRGKTVSAYLLAWRDYLRSLPALRPVRKDIQARRQVSDHDLLSVQRKIPMPLIWHGLPQLSWDIVCYQYFPLLALEQTRAVPEFTDLVLDNASAKAIVPTRFSWKRATNILHTEGFSALLHHLGRLLQWRLVQP